MRFVLLSFLVVLDACGGSRCKEVEHARLALVRTGAAKRGSDIRVTVPFDRANQAIAALLAQEPVTVPLDPPDLGPIEIDAVLTAVVRSAVLQPGAPGKVRVAVAIDVVDRQATVAAMAAVVEVEPVLTRAAGEAELTIGFGPQHLVAVTPTLEPDTKAKLAGVVERWVPERLKAKLPRVVRDAAAKRLAGHLTGAAWQVLRTTLMTRLGDVTRLRLRLPDVPLAHTDLRSTAHALIVDIATDLPVRRGLGPGGEDDLEVGVRLSGSVAAELANWAIDEGHAPRWYDRNMKPKPTGEFRPRFDYLAEDRGHPLKVYAFQERGGCSYFRVGVQATIAIEGERLRATVTDRELEAQSAAPLVEALAWAKFFVSGGLDRSKRVAGHTRLTIGTRTLETRVVTAAIVDDELRFGLAFDGTPP